MRFQSVHQCHIVCWVEQLAFEGTLFIISTRFGFKHPSTVLIALPGFFFFNLAHTNDVGQLSRGGNALVDSVQGKRATSKNFSMTGSQMMAQILHGAEINVNVVPLRGMFPLPSRRKVCITSNWHVVVLPDWTLLAIHGGRHFSGSFFFRNRTKAAAPSSSWICRRGIRTKWVVLRRGMCREV